MGMALLDSTKLSPDNWKDYTVDIGHLVAALRETMVFRPVNQNCIMDEERA